MEECLGVGRVKQNAKDGNSEANRINFIVCRTKERVIHHQRQRERDSSNTAAKESSDDLLEAVRDRRRDKIHVDSQYIST